MDTEQGRFKKRVPVGTVVAPASCRPARARPLRGRGTVPAVVLICALWLCFGLGLAETAWAQFNASFNWVLQGPNSTPVRIVGLAANPQADSILYLAAPGGGIWKSTDGGQGWAPQTDSAISGQVCSVAVDPASPDIVYAGTGDSSSPRPAQGVARSADGGLTWSIGLRFTNRPVCLLAIDPQTPAHIFAASSEGLFFSSNSGSNWKKVLSQQVTDVAFDGQGNVYAASTASDPAGMRQNLLLRSSDAGAAWTNLPLPAPDTGGGQAFWVNALARGSLVYVAVTYKVSAAAAFDNPSATPLIDFYRSSDAGVTWTLVPNISPGVSRAQLLFDPSGNGLYLAGQKLLYSQNKGDNWTTIQTFTRQFNAMVFSFGSILLAGEQGLEVVTPPGGVPPNTPSDGPVPGVLSAPVIGQYLTVSYDARNQAWIAGPNGVTFFNVDLLQWRTPITDSQVARVAASPTTSGGANDIYALGNTLFYRSRDGGNTFSSSTVIPGGQPRAPAPPLLIDPLSQATVYVAGRRVYRSTNDGASFAEYTTVDSDVNRVVTTLAISPASRSILFAATACLSDVTPLVTCPNNSTIWRSTNYGQSWTRLGSVPGLVNRLAVDPRQAGTLYAAIGAFPGGAGSTAGYAAGDLLRTPDGMVSGRDANWFSIRNNLPQVPINAVAIDPNSAGGFNQPTQTLYAGTDAGVFVTYNGGSQWTPINNNLPPAPVTDLSLRGSMLRAATWGRGVYQVSVSGSAAALIVSPLSTNVAVPQGASFTGSVSLSSVAKVHLDWHAVSLDPWLTVKTTGGGLDPGNNGQVSFQVAAAGLQPGAYLGRVRITTGVQTEAVLVNLQVSVASSTLVIASGNNASAPVGSILPPLVVQVIDAGGNPVAGAPVTFAIGSGGGSLSVRSAVTDSSGRASSVLTLPGTPGAVQVTSTSGTSSVHFTATAVQAVLPSIQTGAAVNGASFNAGAAMAPGTIVSIFGSNFAPSTASAPSVPLPTSLAGTRVLVADREIPLFYVSPDQVNALLPYEVVPGVYPLTVVSSSGKGSAIQIQIGAFAPGVFTTMSTGTGQGVFVAQDGLLVSSTNPARRGSVVSLYATGLGPVDPPVISGAAGASSEPLNRTLLTPSVRFDLYDAEVLYSGLAPGFVGLYQVNVRVPSRLSPAYNIPVSLMIGGATSNRVTIPVQ